MGPRVVAVACALIALSVAGSAGGGVVYSQNFEGRMSHGLDVRNGSWQLASGLGGSTTGLRAHGAGHNVVELKFPGGSSDDVRLELDVRLEEDSGFFGVQINAEVDEGGVTPHEGYEAFLLNLPTPQTLNQLKDETNDALTPFRDTLLRYAHNTAAELSNVGSVLEPGQTYHVTVERTGDGIAVYVWDELWFRANDDTWHGGSLALHLFRRGTIDNITVTQVPEPGLLASGAVVLGMLMRRRRLA